ncbi:MAG: DnaJ domain-containing protein [Bacteroidetes bacterium]|nr:DnaJ domain-containing protein [Bacteroidota bacterium]
MFKDYYEILGVTKEATEKEIKKSFRSLAMEYHPDNNDDPYAHKKFLDINEAYQVLGDQGKRQRYDGRYEYQKRAKARGNTQSNYSAYYSANQSYQYRPTPPPKESAFAEFSRYSRVSRIISWVALVFSSVVILDYFMAVTSPPEIVMFGSLNQGPAGDMILRIRTSNQEFLLDYKHFERVGRGDLVSLRKTPIFGITTHLYIHNQAQAPKEKLSDLYKEKQTKEPVYSLTPHYGIYNVFSFFLIAMLTVSLVGVFLRNRPDFLLKIGVFNALLIVLTFFVLLNS